MFKDYEGFDIANEDDDLEEFLGIPRKNPKVFLLFPSNAKLFQFKAEPVKTGAVAAEVKKLNPGKLDKEVNDANSTEQNELEVCRINAIWKIE